MIGGKEVENEDNISTAVSMIDYSTVTIDYWVDDEGRVRDMMFLKTWQQQQQQLYCCQFDNILELTSPAGEDIGELWTEIV